MQAIHESLTTHNFHMTLRTIVETFLVFKKLKGGAILFKKHTRNP